MDITYVHTCEGWAYLAIVVNLASQRVAGWAIADHIEASPVCDAMRLALTEPDQPPSPQHVHLVRARDQSRELTRARTVHAYYSD
jgi:transposase InsO family protein